MTTTAELRKRHGLPPNTKGTAVINYALRHTPGGSQILQAITRVHEMQRGRVHPDPALQDVLDLLRQAKRAMAEALLAWDGDDVSA